MDPGQSKLMEVIQHLIDALEALAERVDRMDARLRIVERPFCDHRWDHLCDADTGETVRTCVKCGLKEYMP